MSARDQLHIRDAETVALVRELARQTGRSMAGVVREAVHAYAPPPRSRAEGHGAALRRALEQDQAGVTGTAGDGPAFELDDLYGKDGLPR